MIPARVRRTVKVLTASELFGDARRDGARLYRKAREGLVHAFTILRDGNLLGQLSKGKRREIVDR